VTASFFSRTSEYFGITSIVARSFDFLLTIASVVLLLASNVVAHNFTRGIVEKWLWSVSGFNLVENGNFTTLDSKAVPSFGLKPPERVARYHEPKLHCWNKRTFVDESPDRTSLCLSVIYNFKVTSSTTNSILFYTMSIYMQQVDISSEKCW
jgi:hypothetical protein